MSNARKRKSATAARLAAGFSWLVRSPFVAFTYGGPATQRLVGVLVWAILPLLLTGLPVAQFRFWGGLFAAVAGVAAARLIGSTKDVPVGLGSTFRGHPVTWLIAACGVAGLLVGPPEFLILSAYVVGLGVAAVLVSGAFRKPTEAEAASDLLGQTLSKLLGVDVSQNLRVNRAGQGSISPTPGQALLALESRGPEIDAGLAGVFPQLELQRSGSRILIVAASPDTIARRAAVQESRGLIVGYEDDGDVRKLRLAPGTTAGAAQLVDAFARSQGFALTTWEPYQGRAVTRRMDDLTLQVRDRTAALLHVAPWEIDLSVEAGPTHIASVTITRAPEILDHDKRHSTWEAVVASIPGGSNGWTIDDDATTGRIVLTYGEPRALPQTVSLDGLLPERLLPDAWAQVPFGIGETGAAVGFDLQLGPHSLWVGPTGSGKTVALLSAISQLLTRGHQVAIIDPTKGGVDFSSIEPFTVGFARTFPESVALIEAVYEEGQRRKAVLLAHQEVKWSDLPAEVRQAEHIHPLTLVIDELASLLIIPPTPKGLAKDDPRLEEIEELTGQKSLLQLYVGKIARELRFVGVFLQLAVQRPDAAILGGEMRSNLTSVCQLAKPGSSPSVDSIRMVFPSDAASEAYETLRDLDDGRSRGLGVVAGDGGGVQGVRVAFAPMREIPALLDSRGVRPPEKWVIAPTAAQSSRPAPIRTGDIIPDEPDAAIDLTRAPIDLGDLFS